MVIAGLNYFYRYMNAHYGDGWMLVGGAAAWEHILDASSIQDLVQGAYSNILPDDLDVLTVGKPKTNDIKVQCSEKIFDVEFVQGQSMDTTEAQCKNAKVVRGARVANIEDIINKYIIATSTKAEVRQTRVRLLQMIKAKEKISPLKEREIFLAIKQAPALNPFIGAMGKLRPVAKK